MSNINVTYEAMRDAAVRLDNGKAGIDDQLEQMRQYIDGLVSGGFVTTAASGAFQERFLQFTASAGQMVSALHDLGQFLRAAADTLEHTDEALAARVRQ